MVFLVWVAWRNMVAIYRECVAYVKSRFVYFSVCSVSIKLQVAYMRTTFSYVRCVGKSFEVVNFITATQSFSVKDSPLLIRLDGRNCPCYRYNGGVPRKNLYIPTWPRSAATWTSTYDTLVINIYICRPLIPYRCNSGKYYYSSGHPYRRSFYYEYRNISFAV